jgi:hypothetical protein
VLVVVQRGRHRRLHRGRHHHPGVLADLQQVRDEFRVAGDETSPVPGHVRPFGQ